MLSYLKNFSENCGYSTTVDKNGNLYSRKENSVLCLQAHYDMVCIGEAPNLEIYEEEGYLKAKNSSLGADNGIGIAMIMSLMKKGEDISALFTNDEEVGLIGASNLDINILEYNMLNLDSEEEGEVFIGCAGGLDFISSFKIEHENIEGLHYYKLSITGLPGGHSGLDIDKDIPNAFIEIIKPLNEISYKLVSIKGGERRNSIPVSAEIIIGVEKNSKLKVYDKRINVVRLEDKIIPTIKNGHKILNSIKNIKNGLVEFNEEFQIPETSLNLALIDTDITDVEFIITMRSNDEEKLELLNAEIKEYFSNYNYVCNTEYKYKPWKPVKNDFSKLVLKESKEIFKDSRYKVIHAGLECAVIKDKQSHLNIASIGPNIYYPHTNREKVEIKSVYNVIKLINKIVYKIKKVEDV
jgi:dipeptidase D